MGRLKSISSLGSEHTKISMRVAAELARKMRAAGYPVTVKMLHKSTPHVVARKVAPKNDPDAPGRIEVEICRMAGFLPAEATKP